LSQYVSSSSSHLLHPSFFPPLYFPQYVSSTFSPISFRFTSSPFFLPSPSSPFLSPLFFRSFLSPPSFYHSTGRPFLLSFLLSPPAFTSRLSAWSVLVPHLPLMTFGNCRHFKHNCTTRGKC
jgi:hypothetical protein